MTEPTTVNKAFTVPNTGDLVSAWGTAALNPNFSQLDGILGGVASFSLSSATTIALTAPTAGTITPGAGPNQQSNALIRLTGSLSGNAVLQFTVPGFYIIENKCTVGAFYVQLAPLAGGTAIGAPPGRKCWIFYDGSGVDYANPPEVASALDLHGVTSVPAWMTACSTLPYLIKDGTVYNVTTYPALGAALGSTFGGNGVTTFGVPDERARVRIAFDTGATGRLTTAVGGVNGATMGSAGGDQSQQAHTHTDAGHTHQFTYATGALAGGGNSAVLNIEASGGTVSVLTQVGTAVIATTGAGTAQNVQPSIVSFLPLIKT